MCVSDVRYRIWSYNAGFSFSLRILVFNVPVLPFWKKVSSLLFLLAETTNQSLWSLKVIELLNLRKIQRLVGLLKLNCVFTMIVTHKKGDMQEEKGCHSMVVSVCVKLRRSQLFWLVFFNLIQTRVTWENETESQLRSYLHQTVLLGMYLRLLNWLIN